MNTLNELLPDLKLRFNIEHPSFEDCYQFGFECAQAEVDETENPYRNGTKEYEQWSDGWWAGFYGEAPLYERNQLLMSDADTAAANDERYIEDKTGFIVKVLEISGVIAVSAILGYQVIELVA